jgi:hypothetical protein
VLNTQDRALTYLDNVWNATSTSLSSSAFTGNGSFLGSGSESYYGAPASCLVPGACTTLPDPGSVALELRTTLTPSGWPQVKFLIGNGGTYGVYDTINFTFAHTGVTLRGFVVQSGLGFPGGCPRCFGDVELVAGGPGNGSQTRLVASSSLLFSLVWWNGDNFEPIPDAADHGEATEEGISNADDRLATDAAGEPEALVTNGSAGPLDNLWSGSTVATVEVSDRTAAPDGTLTVGAGSVPFTGGFVETIVVPGPVVLSATVGATTYPLGSVTLSGGEVLTLEFGAPALVFVPRGLATGTIWSVTVAGQTLDGTGNLTFGEVPGTYTYVVGSVSGWKASPANGSVTVGTSGGTVTIDWKSSNTGILAELEGAFLGHLTLIVIVLVLVVIAGVVVSVANRPPKRPAVAPPPAPPVPPGP